MNYNHNLELFLVEIKIFCEGSSINPFVTKHGRYLTLLKTLLNKENGQSESFFELPNRKTANVLFSISTITSHKFTQLPVIRQRLSLLIFSALIFTNVFCENVERAHSPFIKSFRYFYPIIYATNFFILQMICKNQ